MRLNKLLLTLAIGASACLYSLPPPVYDAQKKNKMLGDLESIRHTFDICYAPTQWKKEYAKWDLQAAYLKAKKDIKNTKNITTKRYRQIIKDFLGSTKDYHVQMSFLATEEASLPFSVRSANGKYFIDWIDKINSTSPLRVGDELLKFNGIPIAEEIALLRKQCGRQDNPQTDQALAEMNLTLRRAMKGDEVPSGMVVIKVKSAIDGRLCSHKFMWEHIPELITDYDQLPWQNLTIEFPQSSASSKTDKLVSLNSLNMLNPLALLYASSEDREGGLGSRKSALPPLGEQIWIVDERCPFDAYIYLNEQDKQIGYIRIPSYQGGREEIEIFGQIMSFFQIHTDGLVLDQLHNPGGYVFYQYALASILTEVPLLTPKHRLKITQEDVLDAYILLSLLDFVRSDSDAERILPEDGGLPRTYQTALSTKEYCQFIISEWNSGRLFTEPTHLHGIDYLNPHTKYRYTKPILMLIDELDFSGGDFCPAILQDNKRAKLFGTRTAGAGGCVAGFGFPNCFSLNTLYCTFTIAERLGSQIIENCGVTPDIEYQLAEDDLRHSYQSYISAVNQAIQNHIEENPSLQASEPISSDSVD